MKEKSTCRVHHKNKKIRVAVSGGFDPLHIGHIRLFKEAKIKIENARLISFSKKFPQKTKNLLFTFFNF